MWRINVELRNGPSKKITTTTTATKKSHFRLNSNTIAWCKWCNSTLFYTPENSKKMKRAYCVHESNPWALDNDCNWNSQRRTMTTKSFVAIYWMQSSRRGQWVKKIHFQFHHTGTLFISKEITTDSNIYNTWYCLKCWPLMMFSLHCYASIFFSLRFILQFSVCSFGLFFNVCFYSVQFISVLSQLHRP